MTEKRVIYAVSGLPEWVHLAKKMQTEHQWEPCYWITVPQTREIVEIFFPKVIHHCFYDANKGILPKPFDFDNILPLDRPIIMQYSHYEKNALHMMDRMDIHNSFPYKDRVRLYNKLLSYWLSIIVDLKPNLAFFHLSPHHPAEYILYAVCIENNIETIMFSNTSIPGNIYIKSKIHETPQYINNNYQFVLSNIHLINELSPENRKYLLNIKGDYDHAEPWYMKKQLLSENKPDKTKRDRIIHNISKLPFFLHLILSRKNKDMIVDSIYKKKEVKIESSFFSRQEMIDSNEKNSIYKSKLEEYYNTLCDEFDKNIEYIYVPLHYQPERTTSPDGDIYVNQLLMIKLLSSSIPENWIIYVKEHKSQYVRKLHGHQGRTMDDYDDLLALKNVKLIRTDCSPFELIDNSKAVATITGTAGWEAVIRGKPALVFGYAWYLPSEGVISISSRKDCINAINKINKGYNIDSNKVIAFLKSLEYSCHIGYLGPKEKDIFEISSEELINSFYNCINQYILN